MSDLSYKNSPFRNLRGNFSENSNEQYLDLRVTVEADDHKYLDCSKKYLGLRWRDPDVPVDSIAVIKYEEKGKHLSFAPLILTGSPDIKDFAWNRFDQDLMAVGSSDGTVKCFRVPEKGPGKRMKTPEKVLECSGGVEVLEWHPSALNVLAVGAGESVQVWNVETGEMVKRLEVEGQVVDLSWNWEGNRLAVAAGRTVYVFDVREGSLVTSFIAHKSEFPMRVQWAGKYKWLFTSGQNRYENRQVCVFDGETGEKLKTMPFEQGYSALNFSVDVDSGIMFACGRGDDHMKRFQLLENDPYCKILTALGGKEHFRGYGLAPKTSLDFYGLEVIRIYQVTLNDVIPVSLRAYNREREFHEDLFPPTISSNHALTADEWFGGQNAEPVLEPIQPGEDSYEAPDPDAEVTEEFYTLQKMNIVRSTKYNYITGDAHMESKTFRNLRLATTPALNRTIAGNSKFFAVPWQGNGGRLAVFDAKNPRRVGVKFPAIESQFVIHDFEFDPFNEHRVAVGGGDASIKLYDIPADGIADGEAITEYTSKLSGHRGKVGTLGFHPTVANVLASASIDKSVKLWDLEAGEEKRSLDGWEEAVINFDWNYNGDLMVTCAKDRSVKIFDMRQQGPVHVGTDTGGAKGAKVAWLRNRNKIFCVGFGPNSERRYKIMDVRKLGETLYTDYIDRDSSTLTPYFDEDTGVVTVWGRGDTSIKFFEIVDEEPYCHFLTSHNSLELQSGLSILHKTHVDVEGVEIFTGYKLRENSMQPINFRVPRTRTEFFQDDIYVPTRDLVNTMSTEAFFNGDIPSPFTVDLNPGLDLLSEAPVEEIIIKKFVQGDKIIDEADVAENTINQLYDTLMGHKEEEDDILPGDEMSGVDSDEWGDDSSSY